MGCGSYSAKDWAKLKNSRGLDSSANANQTFNNDVIQDKYNAFYVDKRESFDSEDSPESTPIIIGFDVTGSMGYLANEIATNSLNETIMQILEKKPVTNPHMMCAAFTGPHAPLQVTQFEADIRVVEQLLDFKLDGWNQYAYDNILWYFAANHTKIDSFEKRGKKGILIGIGDEKCGENENILTPENINSLFGDKIEKNIEFKTALKNAREKYDVVHIVVGDSCRFDKGRRDSYSGWQKAMPGCVAKLLDENIKYLADVIVAIIEILGGKEKSDVINNLPEEKKAVVENALEDFGIVHNLKDKIKRIFK